MDEFERKLERKSVDTRKGKIFYFLNRGFPGRPPVVFLHGLSSNHTTWLNAMRALQENKYGSLALEIRGHGLSDKTKKRELYKFPVFTRDLNSVLERENIKNFVLVGYSFGGSIAIDYAAKYPEKLAGLILISASHVNPLEYKKIKFLTPAAYWFLQLLAFLLLWQSRKEYYYYRHGKSQGYWHSVWVGLSTMPLSVNFWMLSEIGRLNLKNALQRIKVPTLIIRAQNDPFVSRAEANDMAHAISQSRIITSRNPSHFVASCSQEEVAEIILKFLREEVGSNN